MLPRFIRRALTLVGLAVVFGALPASATLSDLPFEVRFPQEMSKTEFTSSFGAPRSGGRSHQGVDLMAPKMTEVYALADGTVTVIGTSRLAGRYLIVEHDADWETYYIHLNDDTPGTNDGAAAWSLTVVPGIEVGSQVVAGQHIAWVGDSGNAAGSPHTHFELHYQGRAIDPYPYLMAAWEQDQLACVDGCELRRLLDRLGLVEGHDPGHQVGIGWIYGGPFVP